MMDRMMDGSGHLWGMAWASWLGLVIVALVIAALVKYVFFQ